MDGSGRLAHFATAFGPQDLAASPHRRPPALALTAEGPRRPDLIAWASAHARTLAGLRLLAPAGIGALLAEHVGLRTLPLRSGTIGPAATAGLVAAGDIDAMVAFSDPIELRPGDTTTRSLTRLAVFWDIPVAGNRATADLLLATLATVSAATVSAASGPATVPAAEPAAGAADSDGAPAELAAEVASVALSTAPPPARNAVRLWTVRATVDDVPGRLAILAASLARRAVNILSVQVHLTPEGPVDELLVAASPVLSAADLAAAVVDGGGRSPRVLAADAHALVDAPTRALSLATRLLRSPDDLPAVLSSLLPGAELAWRAEDPAAGADDPTRLWLADPHGGGYLLTRPVAPFTPAERARAYAMMDVATVALGVGAPPPPVPPDAVTLVLPDGAELALRRAASDDLDAVIELHARCSLTSRLRRYLAGTRCPSDTTLLRLLSPEAGHSLVVEDPAGRVIALANLMGDQDSPELALLVEDAWQRRRLGSVLARRLAGIALGGGAHTVRAVIHASNTPMLRIMSGLGHRLHREYDGGLLSLVVTLRPGSGHTQRLPSSIRRSQSEYGMEVPT